MNIIPITLLLFPLSAFLILFISSYTDTERLNRLIAALTMLIVSILGFYALRRVLENGAFSMIIGGWKPPFGINLFVSVLSAGLTSIINSIGFLIIINEKGKKSYYYILFLIFVMAINGIIFTGDLFNMFVFIEIAGITASALVAGSNKKLSELHVLKYFIIATVSTLFMLFGIGLLYSSTGSLNIADIFSKFSMVKPGFLLIIFILFLPVILVETETFPFNFWVPGFYRKASANFSSALSALLLSAGIYIFIRLILGFLSLIPLKPYFILNIRISLFFLASLSLFSGEIAAFSSTNIKKILAFSSIGQAGLIISGLIVAEKDILMWGLFLLLAHIIAKTLLFICVAPFIKKRKTADYRKFTGIARENPIFGLVFTIGVLSIAGMPLFAGFWGKLGLLKEIINFALYQNSFIIYLSLLLILMAIILEGIYLLKINHRLFVREKDIKLYKDNLKIKPSLTWYFSVLILSLILLVFGVKPQLLNRGLNSAISEIIDIKTGYINIIKHN